MPDHGQISPEDEDQLVRRVQNGDLDAFEPLVDAHLTSVRALIALRTPAAHLIDELAHETFVFAFRNIQEFSPGTSFRKWVTAIAWNLVRAEIRRFTREKTNVDKYDEQRRLDLSALSDIEPVESDLLRVCVEELPTKMRQMIDLKYKDGCTSEEIGATFGRGTAWVRTMLFRIRNELRICLKRKMEASAC